MRINNNMSAVVTNNQLLGTEQSLSDVMEKLSSGYSINHASDNPSGIAIAGKMQSQIDGLEQASDNSEDGISMLQTAEGALKEVTDMIQRMRELSVQAANGTNSESERETIQDEIDELLEEIDRISDTTQFNTINLLDGTLDNRTYADHVTRIQTSDDVAAGTYILKVTAAATRASITATGYNLTTGATELSITNQTYTNINSKLATDNKTKATIGTDKSNLIDLIDSSTIATTSIAYTYESDGVTIKSKTTTKIDESGVGTQVYEERNPITGEYTQVGNTTVVTADHTGLAVSGTITVNDHEITLTQGMSGDEVYAALLEGAENANCTLSGRNEPLSFTSNKYGTDAEVNIIFSSVDFAKALGFTGYSTNKAGDSGTADTATDVDPEGIIEGKIVTAQGTNPDIILYRQGEEIDGETTDSIFGAQATATYEDGNKVTIIDTNGFSMSFLLEAGYEYDDSDADNIIDGEIVFNVTDIGSLTLHIGANANQEMDVRIRDVSTESMYIDDLNVVREDGAEDAIDALDDALAYVTDIRAQLGAYENRLEHTTNSLDETQENMTSAISRIEDADMASTMVEYTKYTVLQQAGTSALAQANELPQLALQLLQ